MFMSLNQTLSMGAIRQRPLLQSIVLATCRPPLDLPSILSPWPAVSWVGYGRRYRTQKCRRTHFLIGRTFGWLTEPLSGSSDGWSELVHTTSATAAADIYWVCFSPDHSTPEMTSYFPQPAVPPNMRDSDEKLDPWLLKTLR